MTDATTPIERMRVWDLCKDNLSPGAAQILQRALTEAEESHRLRTERDSLKDGLASLHSEHTDEIGDWQEASGLLLGGGPADVEPHHMREFICLQDIRVQDLEAKAKLCALCASGATHAAADRLRAGIEGFVEGDYCTCCGVDDVSAAGHEDDCKAGALLASAPVPEICQETPACDCGCNDEARVFGDGLLPQLHPDEVIPIAPGGFKQLTVSDVPPPTPSLIGFECRHCYIVAPEQGTCRCGRAYTEVVAIHNIEIKYTVDKDGDE